MGRIRRLDDDLIALISAGEVIEGPFSVVKELVENSLDAGATSIDIEISGGGIDRIVVSDNGSGILREDCTVCLERYATSKIATREDIEGIKTYGFRGEALASISAIADVRIVTRAEEETVGTELIAPTGEQPTIRETSRPRGTTVEVSDLFARVPARRKHLAGPKTEARRVMDVVMRHAAVRNDIGFRLIRDGEVIIDCPAGQSRQDRLTYLWGTQISGMLIEVDYTLEDIRVEGIIIRPPMSRGSRNREYFSILKRPIEDNRLSRAVESAYSTLLMRGRYPACVLDITVDVNTVDANVHPTKREVRITDMDHVVEAVQLAVIHALRQDTPPETTASLEDFIPERDRIQSHEPIPQRTIAATTPIPPPPVERPKVPIESRELFEQEDSAQEQQETRIDPLGGTFKIIGQIQNVYILLEFDDALVIIDQHAAHERVMYERFRKQVNEGKVVAQELLEPLVLELSPDDTERIAELKDSFERVGFSVDMFGTREIIVQTVPDILGHQISGRELLGLMDEILEVGREQPVEHFMDELVKLTACHNAIRAGQALNTEEIRNLLEEMAETPNRYNCPHGRPTMIRITYDELERRFKRTV
ncbi:MAG: DNA mismatch repair endonuclease MutL [Candidatus Thorarchaeota archaeon]